MTPILSLLLAHDHLFSKKGIAAPSKHPLRQAIEKHKARLQAEFTKARLRRRCTSVEDLKRYLLAEKPPAYQLQPRWVRINTQKTSLEQELAFTFVGYGTDPSIAEVASGLGPEMALAIDRNIPDLIALRLAADVTKTQSYKDGKIILQDKASCFPAYMLVGEEDDMDTIGDCIDGCAAPGNKTSHLAALLAQKADLSSKIYACERDASRSKTLKIMMERSGSNSVIVKANCDFLTLDPYNGQYRNVTHLLLDPSCSGSGIIGREDIPALALPDDPKNSETRDQDGSKMSNKRKRDQDARPPVEPAADDPVEVEETRSIGAVDKLRLQKLSNLQTRIVEHALSFPAAIRVTYSTCSLHMEENEAVVARVLASRVAKERGWQLLRRVEQVSGLKSWPYRGVAKEELIACEAMGDVEALDEEQLDSCIRCHPGGTEGTMGFFVCCFVRSVPRTNVLNDAAASKADENWTGFSD